MLALLAEVKLLPERVPDLADQVAADFNTCRYSSTQEQAWLLLAARALLQQPGQLGNWRWTDGQRPPIRFTSRWQARRWSRG